LVAVAASAAADACLTWEWDGQDWVQVADTGPPQRHGFDITYDNERGRLILFGGAKEGPIFLGDTWAWSGASWEQTADFGPAPRTGHRLTTDSTRSRVVLFGGAVENPRPDPENPVEAIEVNDTWEWNGDFWSQLHNMGPPARTAHMMSYDSDRNRVVLFGGATGSPEGDLAKLNDTWELIEYS
jgi:hypothetical protein